MADDEFITTLGGVYEHSDWVPRSAVAQRPFATRERLRAALETVVNEASPEAKLCLIRAHPDLAGKLAREGALTDASTLEQAGLGLDRLTDAEYEWFSAQNARYQETFGFPFIVCARLTTRQALINSFPIRLAHPRTDEIATALSEIHQIARLRLEDLIDG